MNTRRQFLLTAVPAGVALGAAAQALAQPAKVDENDPAAKGIGYRHDAAQVDAAKYPKLVKGQVCGNCALYQGKATDPWAGCPIVGGKQVNAKGWCTAWVTKA